MASVDVFTCGEALAVLLADDGLSLEQATRFRRTVAGSEINLSVAMARLGHAVRYVSRVGSDPMGSFVLGRLADEGVELRIAVDGDAPTGLLLRDCGLDGSVHSQNVRRGSAASRLSSADVDAAWPDSSRSVFVTGLTAVLSETAESAVVELAGRARAEGALVVLDPNIRPKLATPAHYQRVCLALVELADVVIAGDDELCLVTGRDDVTSAAARVLDGPAHLVVGKRGAEGSWATDGSLRWEQPALSVDVVDPVGAGDSFAAGFLSGLLDGYDVPACLAQAAWVASKVVATAGDLEGLPTRDEVRASSLERSS